MRAPELLQQAELLKSSVVSSDGEEIDWETRMELQQLLENVLMMDGDYAVTKQAEQILWNFCFKNCIDVYQVKLRTRKIDDESTAVLRMFLDSCVAYLMHLLGRLCRTFGLQFDCYVSDARLGILNDYFRPKPATATSTTTYLIQFCLIHLGDIARYQKNILEAECFYVHAWRVCPKNGHVFNQLAILETSRGRHLSALALYCRSLYVESPFLLAAGNLEKYYDSLELEKMPLLVPSPKNVVFCFIHSMAAVHRRHDLNVVEKMLRRFSTQLMNAYRVKDLTEQDMQDMLIVVIGEIWRIVSEQSSASTVIHSTKDWLLSADETRCMEILRTFLMVLCTSALFFATEEKQLDIKMLTVVNVALQSVKVLQNVFELGSEERDTKFFSVLVNLLNKIQNSDDKLLCNEENLTNDKVPLPEDLLFYAMLPFKSIHDSLEFEKPAPSTPELLAKIRLHRLIDFGKHFAATISDKTLFFTESSHKNKVYFKAKPCTVKEDDDDVAFANDTLSTASKTADGTAEIATTPATTVEPTINHSKPAGAKRQTKVVPLITILEREKTAVESEKPANKSVMATEKVEKTPEPKSQTQDHRSNKSEQGSYGGGQSERYELPPRFQAARLKQALGGQGREVAYPPQPSLVIQSSINQFRQEPSGLPPLAAGWGRMPPMAPMMNVADPGSFHRTPGVRPPGPAPFPPRPPNMMITDPRYAKPPPPPPMWANAGQFVYAPARHGGDTVPRLVTPEPQFFSVRPDPFSNAWDSQKGVRTDEWGVTDWAWPSRDNPHQMGLAPEGQQVVGQPQLVHPAAPNAGDQQTSQMAMGHRLANSDLHPFGYFTDKSNVADGQPGDRAQLIGKAKIDGQFSLFGANNSWEYALDFHRRAVDKGEAVGDVKK